MALMRDRTAITQSFTADRTIKKRLADGRQYIVAHEGQSIPMARARDLGLVDRNGALTPFGKGETDNPDGYIDIHESNNLSSAVSNTKEMDPQTGLLRDMDLSNYGHNTREAVAYQQEQMRKLREANAKPVKKKTEDQPKSGEDAKDKSGKSK